MIFYDYGAERAVPRSRSGIRSLLFVSSHKQVHMRGCRGSILFLMSRIFRITPTRGLTASRPLTSQRDAPHRPGPVDRGRPGRPSPPTRWDDSTAHHRPLRRKTPFGLRGFASCFAYDATTPYRGATFTGIKQTQSRMTRLARQHVFALLTARQIAPISDRNDCDPFARNPPFQPPWRSLQLPSQRGH